MKDFLSDWLDNIKVASVFLGVVIGAAILIILAFIGMDLLPFYVPIRFALFAVAAVVIISWAHTVIDRIFWL